MKTIQDDLQLQILASCYFTKKWGLQADSTTQISFSLSSDTYF